MNVDKPSVVKDCVVTSVTCGLAVGTVSAVVGAIAIYQQELLALGVMMVAFGAYVVTLLGPVALWLSQDLPSALKWALAGAFLWSFCISHNLEKKGVTGRYATVVKRTKGTLIGGFGLYWLVQLFIQMDTGGRFGLVCVLVITGFTGYCLIKMEEEEMSKNQAREQSEQDVTPSQGADK